MSWSLPPERLELSNTQIHVWRVDLEAPSLQLERFAGTLAEDERRRADRFVFSRHRDLYMAGRGVLRELLSYYLGCTPSAIRFCYSPLGKPELAHHALRFNLSHSQSLALYAFALGRRVGVDLEAVRPMDGFDAILRHTCSPKERAMLTGLAPERLQSAFFRCWVAKEALLKATGEGIAGGLAQVELAFDAEQPRSLAAVGGDEGAAERWRLDWLAVDPGYAAALAVEGQGGALHCWRWP